MDFDELLGEQSKSKEIDPIEIFKRLDKESGKEYLRPPQETVLSKWNKEFRDRQDTIIKLHTGQGKTLIGLLMLQSYMNEGLGPVVFLCPSSYLVQQTIKEAQSFGIKTVEFTEGVSKPPREFLNSQAILVANCWKMFNGRSTFGVAGSGDFIQLGAVAMDDAHKCADIIREQFSINIERKMPDGKDNSLYKELWNIFQEPLSRQAPGTCIDVREGLEALIAVPFWIWHDKQQQILEILNKYKEEQLVFVWNLIKDGLANSTCIFSGSKLQIVPRLLPIEMIPSFSNAKRRILLSATLMEDAFLVRDLNIQRDSVSSPLTAGDVKYSGERMILIPTLLDPSLTRETIIAWLSRFAEKNGSFGSVAIVPSFRLADNWRAEGGIITNVKNLEISISELKNNVKNEIARQIPILVNAYDGIDLPDSTCRILCLDSMPTYNSLIDGYIQHVRPNSVVIRRQIAQRIEQGMGRAIRGSSDWCIVIATGNNLTDFLSENAKRVFLSDETKMQIKIAEELSEKMKLEEGEKLMIIENLIKQCINREEGWKKYYRKRMDEMQTNQSNIDYLNVATLERDAEVLCRDGQYQKAANIVQKIIDQSDENDKWWYLQLMATYLWPINQTESMDKQIKAFSKNNRLHRPEKGLVYSKLENTTPNREASIIDWMKQHETHTALIIRLRNTLDDVSFNTPSELFEAGVKELGKALGFESQRPEKDFGKGPDNLWNIAGKSFWIISCKNMVYESRDTISKWEAGQLSNDIAWFKQYYPDCQATSIFIHFAKKLEDDAFLNERAYVIDRENLEKLKRNVQNFYNSLQNIPFDRISTDIIKQKLADAQLSAFTLTNEYLEQVLNNKKSN